MRSLPRDDWFARVRPVLGDGLSRATVHVDDGARAAALVEHLAACMLGGLSCDGGETGSPFGFLHPAQGIASFLAWKNPHAVPRRAAAAEADLRVTTQWLGEGSAASITWSAQGREVALGLPRDRFGWLEASTHAARIIRDVLTRHAPAPRGTTWLGHPHWPFHVGTACTAPAEPERAALRSRRVLVVGLGSLGSEALRVLWDSGAHFPLVDDGRVSVFNPARQWFALSEVGRDKVDVLRARLPGAVAVKLRADEAHRSAWDALLTQERPDVVLLATGTHHHGMLADMLWQRGIPHVAACCYPRARFFEVATIIPSERTPCLHCYRAHVWRGIPAATPVDDETAAFLYQHPDDVERQRLHADLVAEPATRIETFRPALLLARCAAQVLAERRAPWFRRLLQASTTLLLGGNTVDPHADGSLAYGISQPGQVVRLGLEDVVGAGATETCHACGRVMDVRVPAGLPEVPDGWVPE